MAQGRAMHQNYRDELAGLAADYRREKTRIIEAGRAEWQQLREQLKVEFCQAKAALLARQQKEWQKTVWRERSLLGRAWNAYDAGRSAKNAVGQVGKTLWASVSARSRLTALRQQQAEERLVAFEALNIEVRRRHADLSADIDRRLDDNHERYLAAGTSTHCRYSAEKRDYAGKWAEHSEARREAWQQFREKWKSLELDRRRNERQQANLQGLYQQQRENLRMLKGQETQASLQQYDRGKIKNRDDDMER